MNKKYILLFVGVVLIFIIFVVFIFFQQTQTQAPASSVASRSPASSGNQKAALQNATETKSTPPTVTLAPMSNTPREAARQFYMYYFASQTNPLADGAYKTNPYLSQNFKDELEAFYNNGNTPAFCLQNKRDAITVGKEQNVYYDNQYLKLEIISEAAPATKDLYRVVLEQSGNTWLVYDITCM